MTPPELSCPEDVTAEALPDRHYALVNVTAPASTGRSWPQIISGGPKGLEKFGLLFAYISLLSVLILSLCIGLVGLAGCLGTVEVCETNNWNIFHRAKVASEPNKPVLIFSLFVEMVGLSGCLGTVEVCEANNWKEMNLNRSNS